MTFYTRRQILETLSIDDRFVVVLEDEEIIARDAPPGSPGEYSEKMLERIRVAHNLVEELEVNLAGAAIIVRMREEMAALRHHIERVLEQKKP